MDFSHYLKKQSKLGKSGYGVERKCLECGKEVENTGSHLYYQKFCSQSCKDKYIGLK